MKLLLFDQKLVVGFALLPLVLPDHNKEKKEEEGGSKKLGKLGSYQKVP